MSHDDLLTKIVYPYILPTIKTFTSNITNPLQMGTKLNSNQIFSWVNESANYREDNIDKTISYVLRDVTAGSNLAWDTWDLSPITYNFATNVQKTGGFPQASNTWRITGTNTRGVTFFKDLTVNWRWKIYWGKSASLVSTATEIKALPNDKLATTENGNYNYPATGSGQDQYLAYPTGFGLASSLTVGGFNWAHTHSTVSVTDNGATTNYYLYKSTNATSAAMTLVVA